MRKMKTVTRQGTRLEQLKNLAEVLATGIDSCDDPRALPQLARQYRDTVREIEDIEGVSDDGDEVGEILARRKADGVTRAQRQSRT